MKLKIALYLFACLSLAACQKDISGDTPSPAGGTGGSGSGGGGTPTPTPIADTLVKKIIIRSPGFPADSCMYTWDSNKRLIKEEYSGKMLGFEQTIVTNISWSSTGIITGYTRVATDRVTGTILQTQNAVVRYDAATSRYLYKAVTNTPAGIGAIADSTYYTYTGSYITKLLRLDKPSVADPYDSAYRVNFVRSPTTGILGSTDASVYNRFSGWHSNKKMSFTSMEKTHPLFAPDFGMVVGFVLDRVEDDNFDWDYVSMISGNVTQTITFSGQYADFKYTYSGNYPLTRTYTDLGTTVNYVFFSY